jgi:hypothetical protein
VFLEQLETNPDKYLPEVEDKDLGSDVINVSIPSKILFYSKRSINSVKVTQI